MHVISEKMAILCYFLGFNHHFLSGYLENSWEYIGMNMLVLPTIMGGTLKYCDLKWLEGSGCSYGGSGCEI